MSDLSSTPTFDPYKFTPTRRVIFCDHLSRSGNVRAACARAGITAPTAYTARRRDRAFALAWDAALVLAREAVEGVLAERALEGVEEAVFYHGEEVARRRRFDGRLLLAHLARLDARCAAKEGAVAEAAGNFDALLAELGGAIDEGAPLSFADFVTAEEDAAIDAARAELGIEEEWDKADPDEVLEAGWAAREEAEAAWEGRLESIHAAVDGMVGQGATVPTPGPSRKREGSETYRTEGEVSRNGVGFAEAGQDSETPPPTRHPCAGRGRSTASGGRGGLGVAASPVGPLPAQGAVYPERPACRPAEGQGRRGLKDAGKAGASEFPR